MSQILSYRVTGVSISFWTHVYACLKIYLWCSQHQLTWIHIFVIMKKSRIECQNKLFSFLFWNLKHHGLREQGAQERREGEEGGERKRGGRGEDWLVSFNLACKWIHTVERRHTGTPTFIRYAASIRATRRTGWKDRSNSRTFLSEILIQRQWACCHSSSGVWRGNTVRGRCQGGTLKAFPGCRDTDHTHHKTHGSTTFSWVHLIWAGWDHCSTFSVCHCCSPTVSQKYSRKKTEKIKTQKQIEFTAKQALCWGREEMWCVAQPVVTSHNPTDPSLSPVCVSEYWAPSAGLGAMWLGSSVHISTDRLSFSLHSTVNNSLQSKMPHESILNMVFCFLVIP